MSVVHIINSLAMGGAEALLHLDAIELKRRGVEVFVVVLDKGDEKMAHRFETAKIDVVSLRPHRIHALFDFVSLIRKIKPTAIHTHLFPAMFFGAIAKIFVPKLILIHTEHNTTNNRRKIWLWPFDALMYLIIDRVVCISGGVRRELERWVPFGYKLTVIENAIAPASQKVEYKRPTEKWKFISVGRLVEDKNIKLQIFLLTKLNNISIDVYGAGPLKEDLVDLAQSLGVEDRISFKGVSNDLSRIYCQYDAYIHTATIEGFGLVVAEAMSAGLIPVFPDIPGIAEVVGEAGIKFLNNNLDSLVIAVGALQSLSEEEFKYRSLHAIEASEAYGVERHVNRLIREYNVSAAKK